MKKRASILILIFIMLSGLFLTTEIQKNNNRKNKQQEIKNITFETYSLKDNKIKIMAIAQDTENLLQTFEEKDDNGKTINKIECNKKEKVALDIEAEEDKTYIFEATNMAGEKITKTLKIDDEFRNNLIKVNIETDSTTMDSNGLALKGKVNIDYGNNENLKMKTEYKIGQGEWKSYNQSIDIDCNEIVSNKEQEGDNKTIIIYARKIDENGNEIFCTKKTTQFDVDAPNMPEITIEQKAEYPIITDEGICLDNTVTIKFDNSQENLLNQYSVDGGKNWVNCDSGIYTFNTLKGIIYAKSTKQTGLTITKKVTISMTNVTSSSALAKDALQYNAYDGDTKTYIGAYISNNVFSHVPDVISTGGYMLVDESAINKRINVTYSMTLSSSPTGEVRIYFYDENNNTLDSTVIKRSGSGKRTIQIPENTKKIYFNTIITDRGFSGGQGYVRIHNIDLE